MAGKRVTKRSAFCHLPSDKITPVINLRKRGEINALALLFFCFEIKHMFGIMSSGEVLCQSYTANQ